ncbi:ankyrin repeat domain-containing protein, partial [Candidatus Micrarchaeota archaeon]|nr:ankyrin repeat domain-containing protein [Candidatus Micrarchaeota archaeon]
FGSTPLMKAVLIRDVSLVDFLLSQGADINTKNNERATALDIAKKQNNAEMITFLKEHGAKVR